MAPNELSLGEQPQSAYTVTLTPFSLPSSVKPICANNNDTLRTICASNNDTLRTSRCKGLTPLVKHFVFPMMKLKPLALTLLRLTVLQSNGVFSLQTSVTFSPPMP